MSKNGPHFSLKISTPVRLLRDRQASEPTKLSIVRERGSHELLPCLLRKEKPSRKQRRYSGSIETSRGTHTRKQSSTEPNTCHQGLLLHFVSSCLPRDSPSGERDVKSSHNGSLRIHELGTDWVLRVNQRDARELPAYKPYDEIDPAPGHTRDLSKLASPEHAQCIPAVPTPLGIDVPAAAEISKTKSICTAEFSLASKEWHNWCACVHHCQMAN